ncbi:hypothetical protein EVAR_13576_1 [Eumeta japonica]|uniref:Uncharacterized protein n=1 Tax=Eumeta variegata TaxID=151549 RepID=A0A4C1U8S1_EUMVA|nr:hypothetical protein EVAR_13576_1 [Eumeta japonica]
MELEYRILNLYKTRQYDKCLQLCSEFLHNRQDRMIEFIQMRALTVQAKVAGFGYEEVDYDLPQNDLMSTAIAKTPRPGTTFHINTMRNVQTTAPLVHCDESGDSEIEYTEVPQSKRNENGDQSARYVSNRANRGKSGTAAVSVTNGAIRSAQDVMTHVAIAVIF